jgi:hypothetical protein
MGETDPAIQSDTVTVARFLKKNGDYWHYVNNRSEQRLRWRTFFTYWHKPG